MRYLECWCCGRFVEHIYNETKQCYGCSPGGFHPSCVRHTSNSYIGGERYQPPKKTLEEIDYDMYYSVDKDNNPLFEHPEYILVELD